MTAMTVIVKPLKDDQIASALPDLARLRIEVFREFPYLYDGSAAFEERYLAKFAQAEDAVIVAALDGDRIVGAATGAPLASEHSEFIAPFAEAGIDPETVFYCAESVLLKPYRGRGIGNRFFDFREAHAARLERFDKITFCGVIRHRDHPAWPQGYRPLDGFWRKRGYEPVKGLVGQFAWKETGEASETPKPMQFWLKQLA